MTYLFSFNAFVALALLLHLVVNPTFVVAGRGKHVHPHEHSEHYDYHYNGERDSNLHNNNSVNDHFHEEIVVNDSECRDSRHFECDAIAQNEDCDASSRNNPDVVIGDVFCPATCGRCNVGHDIAMTDHTCYPFARQEINVSFANAEPRREDWIGIYKHDADSNDLGSPVAWYWLCESNKRYKCKAGRGTVTFAWLPPGTYKAILSRNPRDGKGPFATFGPYASYAESAVFEVVRNSEACAMRRNQRRQLTGDGGDEVMEIAGAAQNEATTRLRGTEQ